MSSNEETTTEFDAPVTAAPSEFEMLKQRARIMGVQFSPNIGIETLRERIKAKLEGETKGKDAEEAEESEAVVTSDEAPSKPAKVYANKRAKMRAEELKLVRLRITNLNPNKKDLPGEIFTVGNRTLGVIKKYIPYGEATENGYHVPYIMYKQLRDREFLNIKTKKVNGKIRVETSMAREFALEILPPLTTRELAQLAAAQAAAKGMDD